MESVHLIIYIRAREKEKYELKKGDFLLCGGFFSKRERKFGKKGRNYKSIKESFRIKWKKSKKRQKNEELNLVPQKFYRLRNSFSNSSISLLKTLSTSNCALTILQA